MDPTTIANIFDKVQPTGSNIFHEIATLGSMVLLNRVSKFVLPSLRFLLREKNHSGQHCVHIVACIHSGQHAIDLMEKFVSLGANINAINPILGESVLQVAVRCNNYKLVKWMCQHPVVDINAVNKIGWTAYHQAYVQNNVQMMNILKTYGADTTVPNENERNESD
mgnify:CR=1 FL=1